PVRIEERRRIRYVEALRPKLKSDPFVDAERLADHQICVLQSGSTNGIPRTTADGERARGAEGGGVEELRCARIREIVRIADPVGPLYREPKRGQIVRSLRDRHGIPGLNPYHARKLPAADLP